MWKRVALAGVGCVLVTVLAFLIDPILGSFVGIFGVIGVVVLAVASDWDSHPDFEERELIRARRRAARKEANWEKNAAARERDRARYAARQAKLAAKRSTGERRAS